MGAEFGGHPRHPHALTRGMDMNVIRRRPGLDGDAQQRIGTQDGDTWLGSLLVHDCTRCT